MTNEIEFGNYLKGLRKEAGLTFRQLEERSGVSNAYLSQLENAKRGLPSPEILKKIYHPLNVTYEELMEKAGYATAKSVLKLEDINLVENFKKYPELYKKLITQPEIIGKLDKIVKMFYD